MYDPALTPPYGFGSARHYLFPLRSQPVSTMPTDVSDSLSNLKPSPLAAVVKKKVSSKPKDEEEILESWETASLSSSGDEAEPSPSAVDLPRAASKSPLSHRRASSATLGSPVLAPRARPIEEEKGAGERPAKTDAVARRMISAALGVRTRTTKEQREFDAALKEKEKRKRDEERARKKEEELKQEEAKRSVWED